MKKTRKTSVVTRPNCAKATALYSQFRGLGSRPNRAAAFEKGKLKTKVKRREDRTNIEIPHIYKQNPKPVQSKRQQVLQRTSLGRKHIANGKEPPLSNIREGPPQESATNVSRNDKLQLLQSLTTLPNTDKWECLFFAFRKHFIILCTDITL